MGSKPDMLCWTLPYRSMAGPASADAFADHFSAWRHGTAMPDVRCPRIVGVAAISLAADIPFAATHPLCDHPAAAADPVRIPDARCPGRENRPAKPAARRLRSLPE